MVYLSELLITQGAKGV